MILLSNHWTSNQFYEIFKTPKTTAKANVPPSGPSVAPEQRKNASPMAQTGPSGPTDSFAEDFSFMGFDSDSDYPSQVMHLRGRVLCWQII